MTIVQLKQILFLLVGVLAGTYIAPRAYRSAEPRPPEHTVRTVYRHQMNRKPLAEHLQLLDADTSAQLAMKALAFEGEYAVGLIGESAQLAPSDEPLTYLQSKPNAAALFIAMHDASDVTYAGQLYALFGLRNVDCHEFAKRATTLETPDATLQTQSGCIVRTQSMTEVVRYMAQ